LIAVNGRSPITVPRGEWDTLLLGEYRPFVRVALGGNLLRLPSFKINLEGQFKRCGEYGAVKREQSGKHNFQFDGRDVRRLTCKQLQMTAKRTDS
jgi:hypothetical protein